MLLCVFIVLLAIDILGYRILSISICTNTPVQKCPTTSDAWASKNDRYRCTGDETYVCIRVANGTLFEGCMTNFNIDARSGNCPILLACIRNKPYIGQQSSYYPCPEWIIGCPPKNHTDYTLQELYKYPRCIESNLSLVLWNTRTTASSQLVTTSSSEKQRQENKHILVIVIVFSFILIIFIGCFISYVIWKKRKNSNTTNEDRQSGEAGSFVPDSLNDQANFENTVEIELASGLGNQARRLRSLILDINYSEASGIQILPLKSDNEIDLDCIYVPISMTDETEKRNNDCSNDDDVLDVTPDKMFFVQPGRPARFIFMLGEAGFGKTVQCQRITNEWCHVWQPEKELIENKYKDPELAISLKQFDFLFFVQMRDVNYELVSLIDIIQDVYSRYHVSKDCLDEIRRILEGNEYKSLVLLDGLDEWNIPQDKKIHLSDRCIPNCRDMPRSTILISMRSWKFMELEQLCRPKVDKVIRLNGFHADGFKRLSANLISNYFKKDRDSINFQNLQETFLSDSCELKSLMNIPLLAVFCFFSMFEDVPKGYSLTTLYLSMLEALLKRNVSKLPAEPNLSGRSNFNSREPCILRKYPYVAKLLPQLSSLGKMAFESLTSQETALVFNNDQLNELKDTISLDLFLKLGLVIKKATMVRFYEDNIRISFLHKTIQEFLSALYLFDRRDDKVILECLADKIRNISKALEFTSALTFLSGLSPVVGCGISNFIKDLADKDEDIGDYRIYFQYKSYQKVFYLYNLQLRCYREVRESQSIKRFVQGNLKFTLTDVILLGNNSDTLTIEESVSVLQFHVNDINTLNIICIPDSKENGIPNEVIKTFLDESQSIESLFIDGYVRGKCRLFNEVLRISNLRTLGLANVAFSCKILTEMLTIEASHKRLRSLGLLHLKTPDDLDVGFQYQLPSIHWMSTNKSGFIRKACSLPPSDNFVRKKEEIPLFKSFLKNLPKYQNLSTLYFAYMETRYDREMLLEVMPELNSLDALYHFGYNGSLAHQNHDNVYDAAIITCILRVQKLRNITLRRIFLSENIMKFDKLSFLEVFWLVMFEMKSSDWIDLMRLISSKKSIQRIGLIDTNIERDIYGECEKYLVNLSVEKFETSDW